MQDSPLTAPGASAPAVLEPERPNERGMRVLLAVVLALYAFLALMAYYEPITGDGWYASTDDAQDGVSVSTAIHVMARNHAKSNPRLGQLFTMYTYVPGVHVTVTPLVVLLLIALVFVHATGRRPRATVRDASLLLCAAALCWLATPAPGHAYFYRPVSTNYIYSFAFVLLYFLPMRLGVRASTPLRSAFLAVGMFVAGFAVGMFNEHTGPAVVLVAGGYALLAARRRAYLDLAWIASATAGLILGYVYLMTAPGLARRAGHTNHSVVQTVLLRGFVENVEILGAFALYIAPLLAALLVLAIAAGGPKLVRATLAAAPARARLLGMAPYAVLGVFILGISLASPRSHYRLAIAPALLFVIAALGLIELFWDQPRVRRIGAISALIVNVVFAAIFVILYSDLHRDDLERFALAEHAAPGTVLYVPRMHHYQKSPLFYGDTLPTDARHRGRMAKRYQLKEVRIGKPGRVAGNPDEKKAKKKRRAARKRSG